MNPTDIINQWKEQYGEVYLTEINEEEFIFRLLSYDEYELIAKMTDDKLIIDEMVASQCVLDPVIEDWTGDIFAGYTATLAEVILEESLIIPKAVEEEEVDGKSQILTIIEEKEHRIRNSFLLQLPVIIVKTFPQYTFDEVEKMSLQAQVDLYVKANWALENIEGVQLGFDED